MASFNQIQAIGRLTRDPEVKTTMTGVSVANFSVAINTRYKENEETVFLDITCWRRLAEICKEYLKKGSQVFIAGRVKQDRWETDGVKRSKVYVLAENIQFLDSKKQTEEVPF